MTTLGEVRRAALRALEPPPRLRLSQWIEREIRLPEGLSALPGKVRLWRYMVDVADAISDPSVERVTLLKCVRTGFTTIVSAAIGAFVVNEPAPVLVLVPTESDARDMMVSDIEPLFDASPVLRGALSAEADETGRNTLLSRRFPGGSLKLVASRAPRNLRRHTARILIVDEADACEPGAEGNPLRLAERRTLTFANRKIIVGSTPLAEDTSNVLRSYGESDQRVFEVPCPQCGTFTEIMWGHIEWPLDHPEQAAFRCPSCKELIAERFKASMVEAGRWRSTKPEIVGHAGFRLNALVSVLPNARWSVLAREFLAAKEDPAELQTFVNTILAQGWRESGTELDDGDLAARAEPFGLDRFPESVLVVTAGVDVQDDRLEITIVGWTRASEALVLGHIVVWGAVSDDTTWIELDELLRTRWRHPLGGMIGVDAAIVDSGDSTESVYNFCFPRIRRRVFAGKGLAGSRPALQISKSKIKGGGRLALIGVDTLKATIFARLQRGRTIRFSDSLEPVFYEQLASERRVVRYRRGQPIRRFERVSARARAEALDCLCYAFAARSAAPVQLDTRETELRQVAIATASPVIRSKFMER